MRSFRPARCDRRRSRDRAPPCCCAASGWSATTVCATDWHSATADMRFLGIDDYLSALNVAVDQIGGKVDLVGLCQGGWMSLVYAARFPAKVRKLVLQARLST